MSNVLLLRNDSILIDYRLTYDATLAELTSLEEMMRIMVEEDQIHRDVISKLWQVYSTYEFSCEHGALLLIFRRRLSATSSEDAATRSYHHPRYASSGQAYDCFRTCGYPDEDRVGAPWQGVLWFGRLRP